MVDRAMAAAKKAYGERLVMVRYPKGPFMQAGVSDLLCCLDGVFIAAEAKAPDEDTYNGKNTHGVTVKQEAFLNRVGRAGGIFAVFRSEAEFLEILDAAAQQGGGLGYMQ